MFRAGPLVIGGTRNLGPGVVSSLLDRGFQVTVFHRGQTSAPLPPSVEHLYGDSDTAGAGPPDPGLLAVQRSLDVYFVLLTQQAELGIANRLPRVPERFR